MEAPRWFLPLVVVSLVLYVGSLTLMTQLYLPEEGPRRNKLAGNMGGLEANCSVEAKYELTFDKQFRFKDSPPRNAPLISPGSIEHETSSKDVAHLDMAQAESDYTAGSCDASAGSAGVLLNHSLVLHSFWKRRETSKSDWSSITLTAQLSLERLSRLEALAEKWAGPVSAAILICSKSDYLQLREWYESLHSQVKRNLDVHLVVGPARPYPINALRNVAIKGVSQRSVQTHGYDRNEFYLVVDTDVRLSDPMVVFQKVLEDAILKDGFSGDDSRGAGIVYVVAAFESSPSSNVLPASFDELRGQFDRHRVRPMHTGKRSYSGPFSHQSWLKSDMSTEVSYEVMFEPYYISKSQVLFPEQFVGKGFNKQAHHFQMWASGAKYVALPRVFALDTENVVANEPEAIGIKQNLERWVEFRTLVSKRYGLHCKQVYWSYCDRIGKYCDLVCQEKKRVTRRRTDSSLHSTKDRDSTRWRSFLAHLERAQRRETLPSSCIASPGTHPAVDVVFTWVNGSDPEHQALQEHHVPSPTKHTFRFRDFESASTLKYALRSVRRYMPWVNKIYIVTANQVPTWYHVGHDDGRVAFVNHRDIFDSPSEQLPTFNSCAIESMIHRIPGLSECFIYMNDDFFVRSPLNFSYFWDTQTNMPFAVLTRVVVPRHGRNDPWQAKIANVGRMMLKRLGIGLNHMYTVGHHGFFFMKSIVHEVMARMENEFADTSRQRWRAPTSVWLPLVYANFLAHNYQVTIKNPRAFYVGLNGSLSQIDSAFNRLEHSEYEWACFNDLMTEFTPKVEALLRQRFESLYPSPLPHELGVD